MVLRGLWRAYLHGNDMRRARECGVGIGWKEGEMRVEMQRR